MLTCRHFYYIVIRHYVLLIVKLCMFDHMKALFFTLLCATSTRLAGAQVVRASTLPQLSAPAQALTATPRRGTEPEHGSVRRVLDADTYEVLLPAGLVRVRLWGVDAPELGQPYGQQAADSVAALLRGRALLVDRGSLDAYGRTVARLRVSSTRVPAGRQWLRVDSLLVARGWAWAYEPGRAEPTLAGLQQQAVLRSRGLWKCGISGVVRPAVWRAYNKQEKARAWVGCPR